MKKISLILLSVILAALLLFTSCADNTQETPSGTETTQALSSEETTAAGLWADAVYTEDTTLGEGETSITVAVKVQDKTVTFTINTDKTVVGDALIENNLVEGEEGAYGLYIKKVNGITADYSVDQSYWAFYIDGEYAMSGVDSTEISEGAVYELVYTAEA